MKFYTYSDKMKLKEEIEGLSKDDWYQIYLILKKKNEKLTVNNNGVLFDLINVSNNTLTQIKEYLDDKSKKQFF